METPAEIEKKFRLKCFILRAYRPILVFFFSRIEVSRTKHFYKRFEEKQLKNNSYTSRINWIIESHNSRIYLGTPAFTEIT